MIWRYCDTKGVLAVDLAKDKACFESLLCDSCTKCDAYREDMKAMKELEDKQWEKMLFDDIAPNADPTKDFFDKLGDEMLMCIKNPLYFRDKYCRII